MGNIADKFAEVFRDYVTPDVPASGIHNPPKSSMRELGVDLDRAVGEIGAIFGTPSNIVSSIETGYIDKTTGEEAVQAGWRRTDFIAVTPDHYLFSDDMTPVSSSSAGCNLAFYDAALGFLGHANFVSVGSAVHAGSISPDIAYVRAGDPGASSFNLFATRFIPSTAINGLNDVMGQFNRPDWFLDDSVVAGSVDRNTGEIAPSANWRATDFVSVTTGSTVTYTGAGNTTLTASVAIYDADKTYLGYLLASTKAVENAVFTIDDPAVAFVRASAQAAPAHSFFAGLALDPKLIPTPDIDTFPTFFAPAEAYALKGERLTMYARGICADRSFDLAWNLSEANERLAAVLEAAAGDVAVELAATNHLGETQQLAAFPVHVSGTPVNPAAMRNFIHLGDSTVEGTARAGIQGAMANEISRRLNGTGTALLSGAQSPAALALTNTRFLGTLGDQPVKHEGRGGWRAAQYVQLANVGEVPNAFWNPSTSEFDLDYYLTTNGFDAGSLSGGVDSTGTNLTIIIQLGWNDVYSKTPGESKADMAALIDAIHATHPNTDIIVTGLTAGAPVNIKNFSGSRLVSERRIFEDAVLSFGTAYRELAADKPNTSFLQTSHVFDPELGYDTTTKPLSIRSTETLTGAIDHVHPNALGYAMLADATFYKIIHDYCQ